MGFGWVQLQNYRRVLESIFLSTYDYIWWNLWIHHLHVRERVALRTIGSILLVQLKYRHLLLENWNSDLLIQLSQAHFFLFAQDLKVAMELISSSLLRYLEYHHAHPGHELSDKCSFLFQAMLVLAMIQLISRPPQFYLQA